MEYKLGDPERGKTIFQGIIDSHPKRWDLWSVFIDMEAGQRNTQSIRFFLSLLSPIILTENVCQTSFRERAHTQDDQP
jgi:rRNA biogenesis protein RRP5